MARKKKKKRYLIFFWIVLAIILLLLLFKGNPSSTDSALNDSGGSSGSNSGGGNTDTPSSQEGEPLNDIPNIPVLRLNICCQDSPADLESRCYDTSCPSGKRQVLKSFSSPNDCSYNCNMPLMIGGFACIDSDMSNANQQGRDIYRIGLCRGGGGELAPYTDHCESSTKLFEYYCGNTDDTRGTCVAERITCNCVNGVCAY